MTNTYVMRFGGVLILSSGLSTPPQNTIKRTLDCYNPNLGAFTFLQYETDPPYQPTLQAQGVSFVYAGYTSLQFSIKFVRFSDGYLKTGTGAFTVDSVNNIVYYSWGNADTNMTGTWRIFLAVQMVSGGVRRYEDTIAIAAAPTP